MQHTWTASLPQDLQSLTGNYNYDPFGRTDTVTVSGVVEQRYTYNGYDQISSEQQYNGTGLTTTNYAYDALGRTGNRYAFGGGNPLSNIELDGHD